MGDFVTSCKSNKQAQKQYREITKIKLTSYCIQNGCSQEFMSVAPVFSVSLYMYSPQELG